MIPAVSTNNPARGGSCDLVVWQDILLTRAACLGVLLIAAVVTSGCTSHGSLRVEVRDQHSHQPISGATVRAEALSFFLPFWPHWRLSPANSVLGSTDPQGVATFESVSFPAAIYIITDQHLPLRLELRDAPDHDLANCRWMVGNGSYELDTAGHLMEARVGR